MDTTSTWLNDIEIPPAQPSLLEEITADIAIIGGGLTGTLAGYLLGKAGKKVVILEKKDISNSTTAYTTAWLNCVVDTNLSELIKMYEKEGARKVWRSGMEAIDLIEEIIKKEKIDCDFSRVSHYRYATTDKEMQNLKREHASAEKLGFETSLHEKTSLPFPNFGSLQIKNQAKFHPVKFLIGLIKASAKYNVVRYENTEAQGIQEISPLKSIIKTTSGSVETLYPIIATYEPFNSPKELFAHKAMYSSYVVEVKIPHGTISEGLYEDGKNPYHYFRVDTLKKGDRIILGGEDHRSELPIPKEKNYNSLLSYLDKLLPGTKYEVVRKWSGGIIETIDGLPYIGSYSKNNPNLLVATGFSGNGMTYSAVASQIFKDIILENENPYGEVYKAGRKTRLSNFLKKALDFSKEFFGGAVKNIFKF